MPEDTVNDDARGHGADDLGGDDRAADGVGTARRARGPWAPVALSLGAAVAVLGLIVIVALRPSGDLRGTTPGTPALLQDAAQFEPMPLPDTTLPALAGFGPSAGRDLSDLRGTPLVVNFWASWCAPCIEEMPALQRVADDMDVKVIGVDYIDRSDEAAQLAERLGINYELLRDDDGEFGRQVGLIGTPTTLFVDREGTIVRRLTGELSEARMREVITAELL